MPSKAAQDRITGLQSQLAETQRMAKLYSMPYVDSNGQGVESAAQAGKDKAGKPQGNPDYLPSSASMYLQEAGRVQTALSQAQQAAESEDKPATSVHSTAGGGLVAVTATPGPDNTVPDVTSKTIAPDKQQLISIPGVGVGVVDPNKNFTMVWQNQNLTPSEKVTAAYQGYGAYATWLNSQTQAGSLDETKRKNLWDAAHQQYTDQLDALKAQQQQQVDDQAQQKDAAGYSQASTAEAAKFASDMANTEVNSIKDRVSPSFGPDFAANFSRIGDNPGGGQSNIKFGANDFSFQAPDPVALGQQQFARAMAHISPYASFLAGHPVQTPAPPQLPAQAPATAPTGGPQSVSLAPATSGPADNSLAGIPYPADGSGQ